MSGGSHNRRSGRRAPAERKKPYDAIQCAFCRKKSYATRQIARRMLRTLYPGERGAMHPYRCPNGGDGWHLGHRPWWLNNESEDDE